MLYLPGKEINMLEAIQIPLLLKAIDFIFDEGRKIIVERHERQKSNAAYAEREGQGQEPVTKSALPEPEREEEVKHELVTSKIDEILWKDNEMEVQHLVRLLETYSRNYHLTKEQYAKWGSALVPPIIMHNMTEAENSMLETIKQLEDVLSKVYKKDITPNN